MITGMGRTGRLFATGESPTSGQHLMLRVDHLTGAGTAIGPTLVTSTGFGDTVSGLSHRGLDGLFLPHDALM